MPNTSATELRGVIWDMDGTMVDTGELHYRAWCQFAEKHGLPFSRADFEATFGCRNPEILQKLYPNRFTNEEIDALGTEKENFYRKAARKGVTLLPGVQSLLEEIHQADIGQAIGTSAPRENLDLILELTNSRPFFSASVAMEDTQNGKPNPDVFLLAARQLQVASHNCLVVEDAVAGVQAAKAGGMMCLAVTFVGHHPAEKLKEAGADYVVSNLQEVNLEHLQQVMVRR